MKMLRIAIATFAVLIAIPGIGFGQDPLPSWNDGPAKKAIMDFVQTVTDPTHDDFVPANERIATFDNDGCLWSEQPIYHQLAFAIDRVLAMSKDHPEWATEQPFKGVLEHDLEAVKASGMEGLIQLLMASHAGMTSDQFANTVKDWIESARHPRFDRPYTEMVYQPMLELLDYLRDNEFKVFIVSGGGIDFLRVWSEEVYGIPPENVVGSSIKTKFEIQDGEPVIVRLPEVDFIDDKEGKPIGIHKHIGRRPIAAFGNSDGDLQMLQWTTSGSGRRLGVIIHHTDEVREWKYDTDSLIGQLDKALDAAKANGWTVVDMKAEWKTIYPFQLED